MTGLWLIVWLIQDTPELTFSPEVNNWVIGLMVCVALDLMGGKSL